jgi:hypothetical protein
VVVSSPEAAERSAAMSHRPSARPRHHERTFPRKRLVKFCTKRFRGNVMDVAASAITIRIDALSCMSACFHVWPRCINMQADEPLTAAGPDQSGSIWRIRGRRSGQPDRWQDPCTAPAEMAHFETARFCSPSSSANSRRLAFHGGCAMFFRFPAATRFPQARLIFRGEIVAAAPGPGRWVSGPAAGVAPNRHPPGLPHAPRPRPAAYIWQAVPKEVTPCRTSREGQSGRTS